MLLFISLVCIGAATVISIMAPHKLSDLANVMEEGMLDFAAQFQASGSGTIHIDMKEIAGIGFILIAMYASNAYTQFYTILYHGRYRSECK